MAGITLLSHRTDIHLIEALFNPGNPYTLFFIRNQGRIEGGYPVTSNQLKRP